MGDAAQTPSNFGIAADEPGAIPAAPTNRNDRQAAETGPGPGFKFRPPRRQCPMVDLPNNDAEITRKLHKRGQSARSSSRASSEKMSRQFWGLERLFSTSAGTHVVLLGCWVSHLARRC